MQDEAPSIEPSLRGPTPPIYRQFLKFVLVGFLAAGSDVLLHGFLLFKVRFGDQLFSVLLGNWLRHTFAGLPANLTSHDLSFAALKVVTTSVGIAISFHLNRRFTFDRASGSGSRQLPRYLLVVSVGLGLNTLISSSISYLSPQSPGSGWLLGSIVATAIAAIWNFLGHRFYSFADLPNREKLTKAARIQAAALNFGAIAICGIACATCLLSLSWQPAHDAPVVLYPTYLAWTGQKVPYTGLFDFNFPGTYLIYGAIGAFTSLEAIRLQVVDILLLGLGGCLLVFSFPPKMRTAAVSGYGAFVCLYLGWYSEYGLQREFFCVLLVAAGCLSAMQNRSPILIGILCGAAILIKPIAILPFVWILVWLVYQDSAWKSRGKSLLLGITGTSLPIMGAALWLHKLGAFRDFLNITRNYTPLYVKMDGSHHVIGGSERIIYDLHHLISPDGDLRWVICLTIGVLAIAWKELDKVGGAKRTVTLLAGIAVCFYVYPVFSGQFWRYHYLPFWAFCLTLLSGGLVALVSQPKPSLLKHAAAAMTYIVFGYFANSALQTFRWSTQLPTQVVAVQVCDYLKPRLKDTDTVQPLDWTGGMVEGMLLAHAHLATSFIYNFQFYHGVSTPYIQGLRKRFLGELKSSRPKFILERLGKDQPHPTGFDTARTFPALDHLLDEDYSIASHHKEFNVWVRKAST